MSEREARENLLGRIYKQHLRSIGRLPNERETRGMEQKARRAAERVENARVRK